MKKMMRIILLCTLILAIPVKSIAAASMLSCDSGHHTVVAPSDHHDQIDRNHDVSEVSEERVDHQSSHANLTKVKCNCGSCCVSAMLMTSTSFINSSSPSSEKITFIFSSHIGHVSDGLERPPKI